MSSPSGVPVVNIGVTGHRFLAEVDRVIGGIDEALYRIRSSFPGSRYHILSAIAEGADRIVVHRALEVLSAELVAVLPMPQADYETDFSSPESRQEFRRLLATATSTIELAATQDRTQAYENAGRYIVDESDVMLAVWDGLAAQGRGGVGEIVDITRSEHKPLVIVSAGNRKPGTQEPTSLGERQGEVTEEGL